MIKEISYQKNKKTNERLYESVEIDTVMQQPTLLKIDLLKHTEYFHKKLNNTSINIINDIPNADWIAVERWIHLVCVSKKFKDLFENHLKGYFYPTNNQNYFIFLLDNCINALDETKTQIINNNEKIYWYDSIENETFKSETENNEYLFTLPHEPFRKLSTIKFESIYKKNNLNGIQFYKNINFNRKNNSLFDGMRFKNYDYEGNCLDEE